MFVLIVVNAGGPAACDVRARAVEARVLAQTIRLARRNTAKSVAILATGHATEVVGGVGGRDVHVILTTGSSYACRSCLGGVSTCDGADSFFRGRYGNGGRGLLHGHIGVSGLCFHLVVSSRVSLSGEVIEAGVLRTLLADGGHGGDTGRARRQIRGGQVAVAIDFAVAHGGRRLIEGRAGDIATW